MVSSVFSVFHCFLIPVFRLPKDTGKERMKNEESDIAGGYGIRPYDHAV
jgi:hypothetical protein